MPQFYIVHESTEDTLGSADNFAEAIGLAREAAGQGQASDPVSILESGGKAVRQFVRMANGTIAEQAISLAAKLSADLSERSVAEQVTAETSSRKS
jgi:hypothetical protein